MENKKYSFSDEPDEAREDYVTNKLIEFNQPHASPLWKNPPQPRAPLHVYAADAQGGVVGGLIGRTNAVPEWLEISVIWVDEAARGQGVGRQLMQRAEDMARARGCHFARLSTANYQAPGFYEKLGYQRYGTLADFPRGETDYYYSKRLSENDE